MLSTANFLSKKPYRSLVVGVSMGIMALTFSQTAAAITTKNVTYTVDNQAYEAIMPKPISRMPLLFY